ncbi:DUF500 and SH3 domain-containing protein [Piedraia hortae CBS 480.64]|uniref:DUF500 and SH3 domain-containing protein n=1 Tax=Piedraia hortae CBS 480.64 TaxID=1314780 RepID=A0A6A7BUA8_9PEZI|nr:DUF500 and SH3 domain-containing protein [Piedraia hortae CBS 480.64]
MPISINNPLPSSMSSETRKCAKILESFIDPKQAFGPDKVIPRHVLAQAKGFAILTVFKAGFLGSGRFGSGVVVARLSDGTWSAPSAIGTVGGGFGGQVGFELTDFVFVLNNDMAVKTFAQAGSLTLGGNVAVAAGPVGRNAEVAGAASIRSVAGVFAYSKSKGLFAGVSLEGSVLVERRDANEKIYGQKFTARQLLEGSVRAPPQADALMQVLRSIGDSPRSIFDGVHELPSHANPSETFDRLERRRSTLSGDKRVPPARPLGPKPILERPRAVAKFTFDAEADGDLGFTKGEIITVIKQTELETDWWVGKIGEREGVFPSNYVQML